MISANPLCVHQSSGPTQRGAADRAELCEAAGAIAGAFQLAVNAEKETPSRGTAWGCWCLNLGLLGWAARVWGLGHSALPSTTS